MTAYITINADGRLICKIADRTVVITSIEQLAELCPEGALCSSSVDFPEDYTTDPVVLDICRELRA
jgi:hypothetical protein